MQAHVFPKVACLALVIGFKAPLPPTVRGSANQVEGFRRFEFSNCLKYTSGLQEEAGQGAPQLISWLELDCLRLSCSFQQWWFGFPPSLLSPFRPPLAGGLSTQGPCLSVWQCSKGAVSPCTLRPLMPTSASVTICLHPSPIPPFPSTPFLSTPLPSTPFPFASSSVTPAPSALDM